MKCSLDSEKAILILKALLWNFTSGNYSLQRLSLDSIPLESYEGLQLIPREVLSGGSLSAAMFLLDLFRSPEGSPLYRSKIMTVGYESVGKTTLLDCLFPLKGVLFVREGNLLIKEWKMYFFVLQGRFLKKYKDHHSHFNHPEDPLETIVLQNREWNVEEKRKEKGKYGFSLSPSPTHPERRSIKPLELFTDSKDKITEWLARLKRVCLNAATHGIEIQTPTIEHPLVKEKLQEKARLELSVWDFAGQIEYYQNHHYFISNRTLFLVLWKMDQGERGLAGLEFWLRSLSSHLPRADPSSKEVYYSILIVGTFLDKVKGDSSPSSREAKVREIAERCWVEKDSIGYYEVSCYNLENIDKVQDAIYGGILSHSYMGERVPESYKVIQGYIAEQRKNPEKEGVPLVSLRELTQEVALGNKTLVKRALTLLSYWGECVYFENPPELADVVILDPRFLTKEVLGQLFNPEHVKFYKEGIVRHSDLSQVWNGFRGRKDFEDLAEKLIGLMKRFEVCFVLDEELPFEDQRSLIPGLLPEKGEARQDDPHERKKRESLRKIWPRDPPFDRPLQLERILTFNVVPGELVSRLIVRLHPLIQEGLVWRNDLVLFQREANTQAWIQVEHSRNRFIVTLRGSDRLSCCFLMDKVLDEVKKSLVQHPGVTFREQVRSPYDEEASLDLALVQEDAQKNELQRSLVCPATSLPLKAEKLLFMAGLIDRDPAPFGSLLFFRSSSSFFFPFKFYTFIFHFSFFIFRSLSFFYDPCAFQ